MAGTIFRFWIDLSTAPNCGVGGRDVYIFDLGDVESGANGTIIITWNFTYEVWNNGFDNNIEVLSLNTLWVDTITGNNILSLAYNFGATLAEDTGSVIQTSPSGWGGGWSSITKDICPENRDCSDSYYDGLCGPCDLEEYQEQKKHGAPDIQFLIQNKELFNQAVEAVKASTKKSYSTELLQAYTFAKDLGITTIDNIDQANLEWTLIRSHMAKIMTNFAIKTLQIPLNTWAKCDFPDMGNQSEEMQLYAKLSCQLGLMGQNVETFKPNDVVTRAEFGTAFSRLIFGGKVKNWKWKERYVPHLQALKDVNVMKKIDEPFMEELRWRVMLMMMRSAK